MNIFEDILYPFFEKLLEMAGTLKDFLFSEIEVLGVTVSVIGLLGAGMIVTVLVAVIVKALTPLL